MNKKEQLKREFNEEKELLNEKIWQFINQIEGREYKIHYIYRKINNDEFYQNLSSDLFWISYIEKIDVLVCYTLKTLLSQNIWSVKYNTILLLFSEINNLILWLKWALENWSIISAKWILRIISERVLFLFIIFDNQEQETERCIDYYNFWIYSTHSNARKNPHFSKFKNKQYFHQLYHPNKSLTFLLKKFNIINYKQYSHFIHGWIINSKFLKLKDLMNPRSDIPEYKDVIYELINVLWKAFEKINDKIINYEIIKDYLYYLKICIFLDRIDFFDNEFMESIEKIIES